jgi:type IV secretory pathway VirB4 component
VVVIDKKLQYFASMGERRGEYTALAQHLGVEPIRFTLDGTGTRINILDPRIAAGFGNTTQAAAARAPAGQSQLLRTILGEALGRPISPKEGKALRVAHSAALARAAQENRQAILSDIVDFLYAPDADQAQRARATVENLVLWGNDPACELERMIDEDLQGIVDGPTSDWVNLGSGLTVFDVSALPEDGPALAIVMMIINTWLSNVLAHQKIQIPTTLIVEEAWHLVQGAYAAVTRRNTKLSRGLGLSCRFAFHHISDIPKDSPAWAMLSECGMKLLYGQDTADDSDAVVQLFGLPTGTQETLDDLDQGEFIFKCGSSEPIRVLHIRSDLEIELTNTNDSMIAEGQIDLDEDPPERELIDEVAA